MLYNLTWKTPGFYTPQAWYLELFEAFPNAFTKEEFVARYGEEKFNELHKTKFIVKNYNPRDHDPWAKHRGGLYKNPENLNLITGFRDIPLEREMQKRNE